MEISDAVTLSDSISFCAAHVRMDLVLTPRSFCLSFFDGIVFSYCYLTYSRVRDVGLCTANALDSVKDIVKRASAAADSVQQDIIEWEHPADQDAHDLDDHDSVSDTASSTAPVGNTCVWCQLTFSPENHFCSDCGFPLGPAAV